MRRHEGRGAVHGLEPMKVHAAIHSVLVPLVHVGDDAAGFTRHLPVHAMTAGAVTRALRVVHAVGHVAGHGRKV